VTAGKAEIARLVKRLKSLNGLALLVDAQAVDFDWASLLAGGRAAPRLDWPK